MKNNYLKDPNSLKIIANNIEIKPVQDLRRGYRYIHSAVEVKIPNYDLKEVLISMLEDYKGEEIIELIKEIEKT